jgi:hypothetical protein
MFKTKWIYLVLMACCAFAVSARAQTNAVRAQTNEMLLLDLLVKKGYVTQNEAQQLKAESDNITTNQGNYSKWKLSDSIKSVELFGDVRFRFENRVTRTPTYGAVELNRYRYALRFGLRGELTNNFYYGFRLDTAANPRSPWVTFATSSSGAPYQGPFGKSASGIGIGEIYLGWHPNDHFDFMLGKMPNPLFTTAMVWDSDILPEGAAERFNYEIGRAQFFSTFGEFLYADVNPTTSTPFLFSSTDLGHNGNEPLLVAMQGGVKYDASKNVNFKVAGALYEYFGHGFVTPTNGGLEGGSGFSDAYVGEGAGGLVPGFPFPGASGFPTQGEDGFYYNQTGINDLLVMEFPFELNIKMGKHRMKLFGDFAENLDGSKRAADAVAAGANTSLYFYPIHIPVKKNDNHAYQLGIAFGNGDELGQVYGSNLKRGAWETRLYWQHIEQYALDPNLVDSDFFEGRENLEGFYAALAYCFTDDVVATLRYGYASRIDRKLGTGGSNQDIPQVNPIDQYSLLQLDLGLRF